MAFLVPERRGWSALARLALLVGLAGGCGGGEGHWYSKLTSPFAHRSSTAALERDPSFDTALAVARRYEDQGEYGKAQAAYEQLVDQYPHRPEPYQRLSVMAAVADARHHASAP